MTDKLGRRSFEADAAALRSVLPGEWRLLDETTLSGAALTVTFSSIPGTYRTLALVALMRTVVVAETDEIVWRANGDSGNNYDRCLWYFDGAGGTTTAVARGATSAYLGICEGASSRASNFSPTICYWPGYASTSVEKFSTTGNSVSMGDVSANADIRIGILTGRWRDTAAITSLLFTSGVDNFANGCVFSLYGII
jgi:hypothetical protein